MRIHAQMNLSELAELMGDATPDDARAMRAVLVDNYMRDWDTDLIPEGDWLELLNRAATGYPAIRF